MDATVAAPKRPLRIRAVAIAVASIVVLALGGWAGAQWVIQAREDPFAAVPELGLRVFDYTVLPPLGQVFRIGDVDVVLMSIAVLEDGGTGLHFVLRREGGLPRYDVWLKPAQGSSPNARAATSTCGASGRTGWGECYLGLSAMPGDTVTLTLTIDREPQGSFDLLIPHPDGSPA